MNTLARITLFSVLLISPLFINAQDSVLYKIKIERYQSMENTGKTLTTIGIPTTIVGTISVICGYAFWNDVSYTASDAMLYGGYIVGGLGALSLINGIVFKNVGKRKIREYQIRLENVRLSSYATPYHSGFTLTYRF